MVCCGVGAGGDSGMDAEHMMIPGGKAGGRAVDWAAPVGLLTYWAGGLVWVLPLGSGVVLLCCVCVFFLTWPATPLPARLPL